MGLVLLLEVDRGALSGIDSEATAEFQLADRPQGLVDAAGCVGSCFVALAGTIAPLLHAHARSSRRGTGANSARVRTSWRFGRTGELPRGVGEILLVAFAEVPPDNSASASIALPDVCDPYILMALEPAGPVASPKDETQQRLAVRRTPRAA